MFQLPQDLASRFSFSFAIVYSKYLLPLLFFFLFMLFKFFILYVFTLKVVLAFFWLFSSSYNTSLNFIYWLKNSINFERCKINSIDLLEIKLLKCRPSKLFWRVVTPRLGKFFFFFWKVSISAWVIWFSSQSVFNLLSFAWWTLNYYWSIKVLVGCCYFT